MSKTKNHYLYELWEEGEPNPFYVGRTTDPSNRIAKHIGDSFTREKHLRKARKICKALREGREISLRVVGETRSFADAKRMEQDLISKYGRKDLETGFLYNLTSGGDGHENYVWSEEAKKKKSAQMMGSKLNVGRPRPDMVRMMSKEVFVYKHDGGTFVGRFSSQKEAAIQLGCLQQSIGKCVKGKLYRTRGKTGEFYTFTSTEREQESINTDSPPDAFCVSTTSGDLLL